MAVDIIARGLAGSAGEQAEIAQRLVAAEYDPTHQYYNTNDIVVYDGKLYLCTDTNVTGTFNPAKWQQIVVSSELTEIINKLATITNPMLVKGRVDTVNDLPVNAEPGWVYFVGAEGSTEFAEYVYTEDDEWQYIGMAQPIDPALSTSSINPVQNRVITNAIIRVFSTNGTYHKNDLVYYGFDNRIYKCIVDSTSGSFSYNDWSEIANVAQFITDNYNAEVGVRNAYGSEMFNDHTHNVLYGTSPFMHAEGSYTNVSAPCAHAEGYNTACGGAGGHSEGSGTTVSGDHGHAEGEESVAGGTNSHAQNLCTIADGQAQTSLGKFNISDSNSVYAVIIGNGTDDNHRANMMTIDWNGNINITNSNSNITFNGTDSVLKSSNIDSALSTLSENPVQNKVITNALVGKKTLDGGEIFNVINNNNNTASALYAHAEGVGTAATALAAHAEGAGTTAGGVNSHAEGGSTTASGAVSHAEGGSTNATAEAAHAEGGSTTASGTAAHAEGGHGTASGNYSHVEGYGTTASNTAAHAEGGSYATGAYSHGEGWDCTASGDYSHAQNYSTTAASDNQTVIGKYNVIDDQDQYALIVGNGNRTGAVRSNAMTVDWDGVITSAGGYIVINGIRVYVSSTTPTGDIPEGSLGIGF